MISEKRFERIKDELQSILEEGERVKNVSSLVDHGMTLRQVKDFVDKLDKAWSDRLKEAALDEKDFIVVGNRFQAERNEISKTFLLTEKIKTFLGKRLSLYQDERKEVHLKYKPRF